VDALPELKSILKPLQDITFGYRRAVVKKETIPMKQISHGHCAFRMHTGEVKILIDPFLSDNPSRDNGWSGCLTRKNSTQGGNR
jgi:hypothetical protein